MAPQQEPIDTLTAESSASTAPWWAKALYVFGIPAGIALFLVWFLTTIVVARQDKAIDMLEQHLKDAHMQQQWFFQICMNTSPTERERALCPRPESSR